MNIISDVTLYNSRPSEKRSDIEEKTYDYLESCNINFQRIDHKPADTIELCHEIEKYLNAKICKNLFLRNSAKTQFYLLLMDGNKPFVSKEVSKKLQSTRLSFATPDELYKYLGIKPGSVSVLSLINDTDCKIKLAADKDLMKEEYFCCHPCMNTSTLKFRTTDIFDIFIPSTKHDVILTDI